MNAQELLYPDGKPSSLYICECGKLSRTRSIAEECCGPRKCDYCGTDVPRERYRTICEDCLEKKEAAKERERFEKSEKLTAWDGFVYAPGVGYNDGYFSDVGEYLEMLESEGRSIPEYVWVCIPHHFAKVEFEEIVELIGLNDKTLEDFDEEQLKGVEELKTALAAFNAVNSDLVSYHPHYGKSLILKRHEH